jgi:hypothetical protein
MEREFSAVKPVKPIFDWPTMVSAITLSITMFNGSPVDTKVTPVWNAMAAIPGHIKNEVVLIGSHRDGISSFVRVLLPLG